MLGLPLNGFRSISITVALLGVIVVSAWGQSAPVSTTSPSALASSEQTAATQPPPGAASPNAASQEPSAQDASGPENANDPGMFVFKKDVEEVILHATVFDDQRRLVPGLDRNAFTIFEDGEPQPITSFRRQDVPVELGIIVDNSGSMRDKRDEVNRAVLNLIRASNPQDEIFVVNFSQKYYLDQDFTSDVNLLEAALHQVSSSGSTALYDAVVASATHLRNNTQLNKKALLVITDGQDNMSQETLQEALRRLQEGGGGSSLGPTVYAIGLTGDGLEGRGREALQKLARGTGGVAYFPDSLDQVSDITRTVAHDLRSEYILAYSPKKQNIRPDDRSVRIEAQAPGYGKLTVEARSGHSYPGPSSH